MTNDMKSAAMDRAGELPGAQTQGLNGSQYADPKDAEIARLTESLRLSQASIGGLHGEVARRDAASLPTDISTDLRERARGGYTAVSTDDGALMLKAADEIERYYGGMVAWKQTAEKKDADWQAERMGRVDDRIANRAAVSDLHAAVPGWKLVPIEPTDDMKDAAEVKVGGCYSCSAQQVSWGECAEIYAAMLAAAPAATAQPDLSARAGEWLPIETAPKDGTCILLGREEDEENDRGAISAPGRWHEEDHDGPDNMGHDAGFMDDEFQQFAWGRSFGNSAYKNGGFQPTKWMPLPAAPTLKAK